MHFSGSIPYIVDGAAKFGMDIQFHGLLTAVVEHAPVFGSNSGWASLLGPDAENKKRRPPMAA